MSIAQKPKSQEYLRAGREVSQISMNNAVIPTQGVQGENLSNQGAGSFLPPINNDFSEHLPHMSTFVNPAHQAKNNLGSTPAELAAIAL